METAERYVPDYENYDYLREWRKRDIENAAEKKIVRNWLLGVKYCLELGGGFGRITETIEPCVDEAVMVDFSKRNLSLASNRLRKAMLLRGDVRTIPFEDSTFDCIVVVRMLHHVDDLRVVLDEIVRVGKDGGTVILGVPNTILGRYRGVRSNEQVLIGPCGHRAYVRPIHAFRHASLELIGRRGLGMFDNVVGRRLSRFVMLSSIDVLTSRIWLLKPELFMRYRIKKLTRAPLSQR